MQPKVKTNDPTAASVLAKAIGLTLSLAMTKVTQHNNKGTQLGECMHFWSQSKMAPLEPNVDTEAYFSTHF